MKKIILILAAVFSLTLAACKPVHNTITAGRYLPEGFETTEDVDTLIGLFIREDGSFYLNCNRNFTYHPSGTFTIRNGILKLIDKQDSVVGYFNIIDKNTIQFVQAESWYNASEVGNNPATSFKIEDGMRFVWHEDKTKK